MATSELDKQGWGGAEKALAAGAVLFALAVGAIGIERPLFIDEAFSVIASSKDLHALIGLLRHDSNEPLYFVLLHGWMGWFGTSEIAARIPSIVFYVLGMLGVYALGREVSGSGRIGLYAAVFYGGSLQAVHLAQKIRPYSLLGLAAAVSTFYFFRCFWRCFRRPSERVRPADYAGFVGATLAGCFTHVWFVFLMLAQLVAWLVFSPRGFRRGSWWRLPAGLALPGAAFLLVWGRVLWQQVQTGAVDWLPKSDLWTLPGAILEFYGGKQVGSAILIAFAALSGLAVLLRARQETIQSATPREPEEREHSAEDRRAQWALLVIFAMSVGVPVLVSVWKPLYWPGRHTVIALPALAVLLAWRLAVAAPRPVVVASAAALLLVALGFDVATRREVIENSEAVLPYADSDKAAAEALGGMIAPGDSLVFTGLSRASVQYYLDRSGRDRGVELISFPAANGEHLGWDDDRIDRATLAAEAGRLADSLRSRETGTAGRIWVVAGLNGQANGALLDALDRHFAMQGVLKQRGAFFTAVAVYQPKSPGTAGTVPAGGRRNPAS